jgi:rare lipoprotein A
VWGDLDVILAVEFFDVSRIRNFGAISKIALTIALSVLFAACATSRPAPVPPPPPPMIAVPQPTPTPQVVGMASWYGPGFHGHRNAQGGIYHQDDLTAASIAFPLGSRVMVTNLDNRRSVEVTVTDRGPFKKGRKIDLSYKAAHLLGMVDKGTAHVRIALISKPPGTRDVGAPLRYWVQVGSFSDEQNAENVRRELTAYYGDVRIVDVVDAENHRYYRVRMGAFSTHAAAEARASDSERFGYPIVIISE